MEWITLYITGEEGFKKEVAKRLRHADLAYMPGNIGNSEETSDHTMYWVDKQVPMRDFKLVIGAKAIWRYRIRIYKSLEEFICSQEKGANSFTEKDVALIQEMRKAPGASLGGVRPTTNQPISYSRG